MVSLREDEWRLLYHLIFWRALTLLVQSVWAPKQTLVTLPETSGHMATNLGIQQLQLLFEDRKQL